MGITHAGMRVVKHWEGHSESSVFSGALSVLVSAASLQFTEHEHTHTYKAPMHVRAHTQTHNTIHRLLVTHSVSLSVFVQSQCRNGKSMSHWSPRCVFPIAKKHTHSLRRCTHGSLAGAATTITLLHSHTNSQQESLPLTETGPCSVWIEDVPFH